MVANEILVLISPYIKIIGRQYKEKSITGCKLIKWVFLACKRGLLLLAIGEG